MLNKEVCKKCRDILYEANGQNMSVIHMREKWSEKDDRRWEGGRVWCAYNLYMNIATKRISHSCPYKLEHIVLGENNEKS